MAAADSMSRVFGAADPPTAVSRQWIRLSPASATIVAILLLNVPLLVASAANGVLWDNGSTVGLLQDPGYWLLQVVVVGITVFAYMWLPHGLDAVLLRLIRNRVIVSSSKQPTEEAFDEYVRAFERWYSNAGWVILAIICGLAFTSMIVPIQRLYDTWQNSSAFNFWWTIGAWFVVSVLIVVLAARLVVAIVWLNRLFSVFDVRVRVMHPDGAGGLAPLGQFSVKIGYFVAGYGLGIVGGLISESVIRDLSFAAVFFQSYALTLVAAYLAFAPLVFFAPFILAHRAMKQAKDEFIVAVSERLETELPRLKEVVRSGGAGPGLRDGVEDVEQLRKLYDFGRRFPVWPFNSENLLRFVTSVAMPLALAVLSLIVE